MSHYTFEPHFDHEFIAAQIDADITAAAAGGTVITGPWSAQSPAGGPDTSPTTA